MGFLGDFVNWAASDSVDPRGAELNPVAAELRGIDSSADSGSAFDNAEVEGVNEAGGSVELVGRRETGHSGANDHNPWLLDYHCCGYELLVMSWRRGRERERRWRMKGEESRKGTGVRYLRQ